MKDLVVLGGVRWLNNGFPYQISEIAQMTDDDPRLLAGYIVVLSQLGRTKDWVQAFADDIQRRGEAAGPIVMKIVKDRSSWTQGTRADIFSHLDRYPKFDHKPFIEAAREIWREHKFKTPVRMCHAICDLLEAEGDASDIQIIEEILTYPDAEIPWVNASRPERMRTRLSGKLTPSEWHHESGLPPAGYEWIDAEKKAWRFVGTTTSAPPGKLEVSKKENASAERDADTTTSTMPQSVIAVLIVAVLALLWLLFRRRS